MIRPTDFKGRFVALALLVFAICAILLYQTPLSHLSLPAVQQAGSNGGAVLTGHAIAPKLGNATAKYVYRVQHAHCRSFGCARWRG